MNFIFVKEKFRSREDIQLKSSGSQVGPFYTPPPGIFWNAWEHFDCDNREQARLLESSG